MENSRGMFSIGDFNEGGAEPDRSYPMQASNSEIDLSSLHVTLIGEYRNFSHTMARHFGDTEALGFNRLQRSGIFEGDPAEELTEKKRGKEEFRKFDRTFDRSQDIRQNLFELFCSQCLSVFKDIHQISKQQIERIEDLDRSNLFIYWGTPVPETIRLPNPASIPRNETKACPEAITDPQEQGNEPNNQEPVPGVQADEVPADSLSEPLLIGIHATNVLSVGRGSHAEEASQNGTNWRNRDLCCCYIM